MMSRDPEAALAIFFDIDSTTVRSELKNAEGRLEDVLEESSALRAIDYVERTPENNARSYHLSMVQAHEISRNPDIIPEMKDFYAAFGANQIVQDAELIAHGKGSLAEVSAEMEAILRREGLSNDEFGSKGTAPEEYEKLDEKYSELSQKIADTVLVSVLRKYRLDSTADLFEKDRKTFEIHYEIGRRLVFSESEESKGDEDPMDSFFREKFGDEALKYIRRRVGEQKNDEG